MGLIKCLAQREYLIRGGGRVLLAVARVIIVNRKIPNAVVPSFKKKMLGIFN